MKRAARMLRDELQTDVEQRHIDAVAKAERAVVRAAERLADTLPGDVEDIGSELGAVFKAVARLRAARKAGK